MSRFDFDITYVKGKLNKVADCLSQYFESDTSDDVYDIHEYVRADAHIDPSGEDLPLLRHQEVTERVLEICALHDTELRCSNRLRERCEECKLKAQLMAELMAEVARKVQPPNEPTDRTTTRGATPLCPETDIDLAKALFQRVSSQTPQTMGNNNFLTTIRQNYEGDKLFSLVLDKPEDYKEFTMANRLVW